MDPSQQRVIDAIAGQPVDRVPVYIPGMDPRVTEAFDRLHGDEADDSFCTCNGVDLTPFVFYGVDLCDVPGPLHLKPEVPLPRLDADNLDVDIFGRVFKTRHWGHVEVREYMGPYLRTDEQVRDWPHLHPQEIDPDWPDHVYHEITRCVGVHDICPVFSAGDGLYAPVEAGIGIEHVARLLHEYPEFIDLQLEKAFKVVLHDVEAILHAGAAFVMISDRVSVENRPTITPDLVERHVLRYYKILVDRIHQAGGKAFFRTSGDVLSIASTVKQAGFDVVHLTVPDVDHVEAARLHLGNEVCIAGNIDVVSLLSYGTRVTVQRTVKETIDTGQGHGRFMLASNAVLPETTSLGNVEAMLATAGTRGKT